MRVSMATGLSVPKTKVFELQTSIHPKYFPSSFSLVYLVSRETEQGMFWYKYVAWGSQKISSCQEHPKQSLECSTYLGDREY